MSGGGYRLRCLRSTRPTAVESGESAAEDVLQEALLRHVERLRAAIDSLLESGEVRTYEHTSVHRSDDCCRADAASGRHFSTGE